MEDLNSRNVKVSYGTASLTLRAFYSSSQSSVRIQPVQAMLPCGAVQQIPVSYRILASELGNGADRADFYHLVSAGQCQQPVRVSVSTEPFAGRGTWSRGTINPLLCSLPFRFWPEDPSCIMAKQQYFLIHH